MRKDTDVVFTGIIDPADAESVVPIKPGNIYAQTAIVFVECPSCGTYEGLTLEWVRGPKKWAPIVYNCTCDYSWAYPASGLKRFLNTFRRLFNR